MSDDRRDSRLPPPAFPPGTRRHVQRNSARPMESALPEPGVDGDGFISPDDPIPERTDRVAQAFISPDDPLPPRDERPSEEEGVVTGIGLDAHVAPEELVTGGDPYVMEVVHAVQKLAESLRRKGEAGLRASPAMSRLEATLRAYCVGYLAGRRAEEAAVQSELNARVQPKADPPDF